VKPPPPRTIANAALLVVLPHAIVGRGVGTGVGAGVAAARTMTVPIIEAP
jgi:hypothetical protein